MNIKDFDIDIYKLPNKVHEYQYQIDQSFFKNFENSLIDHANMKAFIELDKQERLITLHFHIEGVVELECDRSLEHFDYPMDIKDQMLLQYGEEETELTEELAVITSNTQRINVAQYIYEFVGLNIPMKKLHPKYQESASEQDEIVYSSDLETEEDEDAGQDIDPRWEALKKFRN